MAAQPFTAHVCVSNRWQQKKGADASAPSATLPDHLSHRLEIDSGNFAIAAPFGLERNPLPLFQSLQPRLLYGRDVNEDIRAAFFCLNKPVTLLRIKPLDRTVRPQMPPSIWQSLAATTTRRSSSAQWRRLVSARAALSRSKPRRVRCAIYASAIQQMQRVKCKLGQNSPLRRCCT